MVFPLSLLKRAPNSVYCRIYSSFRYPCCGIAPRCRLPPSPKPRERAGCSRLASAGFNGPDYVLRVARALMTVKECTERLCRPYCGLKSLPKTDASHRTSPVLSARALRTTPSPPPPRMLPSWKIPRNPFPSGHRRSKLFLRSSLSPSGRT